MGIPELPTFAIYRYLGAQEYEDLKKEIMDFEVGREEVQFGLFATSPYRHHAVQFHGNKRNDRRSTVMIQTDSRIANVEEKVDSLANQFAELSLITEESHTPCDSRSRDVTGRTWTYSYSKKLGHFANACKEISDEGNTCHDCEMLRYIESNRWTKSGSDNNAQVTVTLDNSRHVD